MIFNWTKVEQDAFGKIKWTVARDTLSTNPDFNETFKIHINASSFQLGAVIRQKLYGRKLNGTQKWYTVT